MGYRHFWKRERWAHCGNIHTCLKSASVLPSLLIHAQNHLARREVRGLWLTACSQTPWGEGQLGHVPCPHSLPTGHRLHTLTWINEIQRNGRLGFAYKICSAPELCPICVGLGWRDTDAALHPLWSWSHLSEKADQLITWLLHIMVLVATTWQQSHAGRWWCQVSTQPLAWWKAPATLRVSHPVLMGPHFWALLPQVQPLQQSF